MANTASAEKRIRQSAKRRLRNRAVKSTMKTAIKKYIKALEAGDAAQTEALFRQAASAIDKAAIKGVIHKNQAARRKARLARRLNGAAQA